MSIFTNYIFKIFIYLSLFFILLPAQVVLSEQNSDSSLLKPKRFKSKYLLGPGDIIYIEFEGLKVFSNSYSINAEGFLDLPDLDPLFVSGKTIQEVKTALLKNYQDIIYNPTINITITNYRPVIVTVRGEVNITGLYELNYEVKETKGDLFGEQKLEKSTALSNFPKQVVVRKIPRLFELISKAKGITQNADLSNITIVRNNPLSNGGGRIKTTIDLLSLIKDGDQSQNIVLQDGDDIFVHKSKKLLIDQIIEVNNSNITPETMTVFINGNIGNNGAIGVKQGSSLYEALSAAGGPGLLTGKIELIRLNRNGPPERRIIKPNLLAKIGSKDNPLLLEGDIINVRKNLIGKTGSIITQYTSPFFQLFGLYRIFD